MLLFGWLGGVVNSVHVLPQMWKIYKTKSVADISISSILIKIIACSLYTIHGFVIWDLPLFVMTSIILLQYVIIFFQYKYYKKNKKCDARIVASAQPTTLQTNTETEETV